MALNVRLDKKLLIMLIVGILLGLGISYVLSSSQNGLSGTWSYDGDEYDFTIALYSDGGYLCSPADMYPTGFSDEGHWKIESGQLSFGTAVSSLFYYAKSSDISPDRLFLKNLETGEFLVFVKTGDKAVVSW